MNNGGDNEAGGGHGPDGGSDHWSSRRSPWDMGLFALLAALMVAFFVLMAGKAARFEQRYDEYRSTMYGAVVDRAVEAAVGVPGSGEIGEPSVSRP